MKYEKPIMELIELLPREVFMTASGGGVVIGPPDEGGEDEF